MLTGKMTIAQARSESGGYHDFLQAVARQLQRTLCGRSRESARQRGAEILPRMHDREDLDQGRADAIEESVRSLDDFPDVQLTRLGHPASRLGKILRLPKPKDDAVDHLLGVHGRGETDVLRDAA